MTIHFNLFATLCNKGDYRAMQFIFNFIQRHSVSLENLTFHAMSLSTAVACYEIHKTVYRRQILRTRIRSEHFFLLKALD